MKSPRRMAALLAATAATFISFTAGAFAAPNTPAITGRDAKVVKSQPATPAELAQAKKYWINHKNPLPSSNQIDPDGPKAAGPVITPNADSKGYARPPQPYVKHKTRPMGKLVMKTNGNDNLCSAAAIGDNYVATAAHCVMHDDGTFNTEMAFIPGYHAKNDTHPFGVWPAVQAYVPTAYMTKTKKGEDTTGLDVAIVRVASDAQGATLENVLGSALPYKESKTGAPKQGATFGYPAQGGKKYIGEEMFYCVSNLRDARQEPISMFEAPGCAIEGGHSGGPLVDTNWNLIGITASVGGTKEAAHSNFNRLHPETFGRLKKESDKDIAIAK